MDRQYWAHKRVLVTGGAGFLGSYVVRSLIATRGVRPEDIVIPRSADCDLRDPQNCLRAVSGCDVVIHLAAVTGGIGFSRAHPASQYLDSTRIDLNMAEAARKAGVAKFVAIGNLFAYAPDTPSPLVEDLLFQGMPGGAHRGVGSMKRNLAVIAELYHHEYGLPMVTVYAANAYGPGDSLDPLHAHVIPATVMKCLRDPKLIVWGDGSPTRDFLFAADVAEGLLLAAEKLEAPSFVNLSSESEISIKALVELIARQARFEGEIVFDAAKGAADARRLASSAKARELLGFRPAVSMEEGIRRTVAWYRERLGAS
ncbi:MAG TPA: NAD-dependent epimerase/dehydratase family protein [Bryobacteraceae bacterium]|nr:NAD-dependent epimerase/dehydratase family protein [Bryobacteraceae bacterium]